MALQTMYQAKSNSPQTTLTAIIAADATSLTVFDGSVLPPGPNLLTLGTDEDAEVVYYSTISGNVVSGLVRGYSGTTASVWEEGTQVSREFTSYDHNTFKTNIESLQNDVNDLNTALAGKQDELTFDATPTASSTNPVTSGGIKTALDGKLQKNPSCIELIPSRTAGNGGFIDFHYNGSSEDYTARIIETVDALTIIGKKLALAQPLSTNSGGTGQSGVDTTPSPGSLKMVTSGGVRTYVDSHADFKVSGTVSASNYTLTDPRINDEHWEVAQIYFATPSNVVSQIQWTTDITIHTVSLSATYAGATNVVVKMHFVRTS